jgi:hypothetical protein
LFARSRIVAEFKSKLVDRDIPSESNSPILSPTVYLKRAVRESTIETNVAYRVADPTVNSRRGVPVMVTDSLNPTVNVGVSDGL